MSLFDADFRESVITHMNEDHADALLAIVQAHVDGPAAIEGAELRDIDTLGMDIRYRTAEGETSLRVPFPRPLSAPDDVRAMLVRMTREARARL